MPLTLATADGLLKRVYADAPTDVVNNDAPFATIMKNRGRNDIGGQSAELHNPFVTGQNEAIEYGAEGAVFPIAGNTTSAQGRLGVAEGRGSIQLTRTAIAAFRSGDLPTFTNLLDDEMTRFVSSWHVRMEHECMTRSDGLVARMSVAAVATDTTLTLHDGQNGPGNRWLRRNKPLGAFTDFAKATPDTDLDGRSVSATPPVNPRTTVAITPALVAGIADNSYLSHSNVVAANESPFGLMDWLEDFQQDGVFNWFSTDATDFWGATQGNVEAASPWTFATDTRATIDELNANVLHGGNSGPAGGTAGGLRDVNEAIIREAFYLILEAQGFGDESANRMDGTGSTTADFLIISGTGVQDNFVEEFQTDRLITDNDVIAGVNAIMFTFPNVGRVPWVVSRHFAPNMLAILDLNTWKMHISGDTGWVDVGGIFRLQNTGAGYIDAMVAFWTQYWNCAMFIGKRNALIADLRS